MPAQGIAELRDILHQLVTEFAIEEEGKIYHLLENVRMDLEMSERHFRQLDGAA